ncbi:MAG: Uma2 family endonuclease [Streptosporangiaceae bacterium]
MALLRFARQQLLRRPVAWPPTAAKLFGALDLPRGYRMVLTGGRIRIDGSRDLRQLSARLSDELPDPVRIELYGGQVVVSGVPTQAHDTVLGAVAARLGPVTAEQGWTASPTATVLMPRGRAYVRPDLSFVRSAWSGDVVLGSDLALAVEVASMIDGQDDREIKRRFYAAAGVSSYLLVDLPREEVVLFDAPCDGEYQHQERAPFGAPLPVPFGPPLETTFSQARLADRAR